MAIRNACKVLSSFGAVVLAALGAAAAPARAGAQPAGVAQDSAKRPPESAAKRLQAVSVTGSLLRRVDTETANPVVTLDRSRIDDSGKLTLGDLLQQLPSAAGNTTNGQNNFNGGGGAGPTLEGGDGAARISLRGLGTRRTLVLIDGQRMANQDLNMIPSSMIERIDVLADGASTVYGSDAIGGVVNIILRKSYQGAQLKLNDGISSHGDGQRRGFDFIAGTGNDRGHIIIGLDYNKFFPIRGTRRDFSSQERDLVNSKVGSGGSSSIPAGRIQVPSSRFPDCAAYSQGQTSYLTRFTGDGSRASDYRCYRGAADSYNYYRYSYIQTAQEREEGFLLGDYKLNSHLSAFIDVFYNHTHSSGMDAPAPTGVADGWSIPADHPGNPFGVTFSSEARPGDPNSGYNFNTRLTGLGPRIHTFDTDNIQLNAGLRGDFGDSSWTWDALLDYGYQRRRQGDTNEVNVAAFQRTIDAGANIFAQDDPAVTAQLADSVDTPIYRLSRNLKQLQLDANGELWDLPAGAIQLSVGALYRQQTMNYRLSNNAVLDPGRGNCGLVMEACGSPGHGSEQVKELYAETLIPLLADQPLAYSLNLDIGIRASKYSSTGTTTNKKIALEWRPIADLLVRGTASQVFRAPDLDELYDGRTVAGPNINDPCTGLSPNQLSQHAAACRHVPPYWSGNSNPQVYAYSSGGSAAGIRLKPEHGLSTDFGLVYNPHWLPGFSASADYWRITLRNMLTAISAQTVVDTCFQNSDSVYCPFINRFGSGSKQAGQVFYVNTPVVNLGNLSTSGLDFSLGYRLPHFKLGGVDPGRFKASLDATYVDRFKNDATPGQPGAKVINYAGTYSQQFGNIARWRSTFTLNWNLSRWSAQWQARYIHRLSNLNADATIPGVRQPLGSVLYHSIEVGYNVPSIHTRFNLGVDNLADRKPPLVYQNSQNYNVDTSTYDSVGRFYWARATLTF